jgi:hypothetical protein
MGQNVQAFSAASKDAADKATAQFVAAAGPKGGSTRP